MSRPSGSPCGELFSEFSTRPDGQIDVPVHQVIKNLEGRLLEDCIVHHIYRLRGDQVAYVEVRR